MSGWVGIPHGFGIPIPDYFAEFVQPSEFATQALGIVEPLLQLRPGHHLGRRRAARDRAGLFALRREARAGGSARRRFSGLYTFLDKGWYFDALYGATFVRFAMWLGRATRGFDRSVVGGLIGGVGRGALGHGRPAARLQSGGVQSYALFILLSVLIIGVIVGAQYAFLVVGLIVVVTVAAFAVGSRL